MIQGGDFQENDVSADFLIILLSVILMKQLCGKSIDLPLIEILGLV